MIQNNQNGLPQRPWFFARQRLPRLQLPKWVRWIAPRPFDSVLLFLYVAVLANFIILSCFCDFSWLRIGGISAAVLTLLFVDRWEYWRYGAATPQRTAAALFMLRVVLIETVAQIDRFDLSAFLYVLLPFPAVLAFGSVAGWGIGGLIWVRYVLQVATGPAGWTGIANQSNQLILFTMGIVFVLTMAKLVLQERAAHAKTEKLLVELEQSHQQLTAYANQVAELATASERNRLARDIHDSLGHYLTVINVQLEKALAFRLKNAQIADRAVEDSKRLAREALDDVRRSVGMLRTGQEVFSVRQALSSLVDNMRSDRLKTALKVHGIEDDFSPQALMTLYRVAQEGLTNVQRHAQATEVSVTLDLTHQEACLSVRDNGIGFDAAECQSQAGGFIGGYGLQGIQERLELVAGLLRLVTKPGHGTELIVVIPRNSLPTIATTRTIQGIHA
jgi:signal transduction histidine kinase